MAETDYIVILEAIEKLPFPMGAKLLCAVLRGETNETVKRCRLEKESCFGALGGYSEQELQEIITHLNANNLIEKTALQGKSFAKVFKLTTRGKEELRTPTLLEKKFTYSFEPSPITEEDKKIFLAFDFFLKAFNDEQKKAITSRSEKILCVAGAGSGKTTVLTKRVEFLTRFCSVAKEKILAITFTRKARQEMQHRLNNFVKIETFNSFAEEILKEHGRLLYGKEVHMLSYKDRIRLIHHALKKLELTPEKVLQTYFTNRQFSEKPKEVLLRIFVNDVFSILDYYANNDMELEDFSKGNWDAKMVYSVCLSVKQEMKEIGLRDFSDQLRDVLMLFNKHPRLIPEYEHILVDEYQDVNTVQKKLLDILRPKKLFAVGDPRQSIFGWRGSKVSYIREFSTGAEVIVLKKNYRSATKIVQLGNRLIASMKVPDLESVHTHEGVVQVHSFKSEDDEIQFLATKLQTAPNAFVLSRTNKQLEAVAEVLRARGVSHVIRNDENKAEAQQGEVTLSTVHAIKGLEADLVFVIGCTYANFPCITSDHPVLELVKRDPHDREEEELRLLYVAISRAKKELHLSYSGTPSKFLNNETKNVGTANTTSYNSQGKNKALFEKLREWRVSVAREHGIPAYMILPDKTLLELAHTQPNSVEDLHSIHGIGPVKAQKYGEELMTILHR